MRQDRQMQMVRGNYRNQFRQYARQDVGNQNRYNAIQNVRNHVVHNAVQNLGIQNVQNQNGLIVVPVIANQNVNLVGMELHSQTKEKGCCLSQTQLLIARKEEAGIQLQAEESDLIAEVGDIYEIDEVNENCILMANLQQASTSSTQTNKALVYHLDGSAEVCHSENYYDNDIFNMFTQEEQYIELLEPIAEPHKVLQNDSSVTFMHSSMEHNEGTVEQHPATFEETHAHFKSLYHNLAYEVDKVNTVNRKLKETNVDLTTELARYKNQESVVEMIDLSKPVTSNSVPKSQESTVVKNNNVISPGIFWIHPSKTFRVDNDMPNKPIKSSVRTKSIITLQHHVTHMENVNYNSNGLSSIGVESTAKTRIPQPRSNTKINRVSSASKNGCIENKEIENERKENEELVTIKVLLKAWEEGNGRKENEELVTIKVLLKAWEEGVITTASYVRYRTAHTGRKFLVLFYMFLTDLKARIIGSTGYEEDCLSLI
nr:hypothetical protein [Tanacetum cinerariifolium]